MNWQRAKSFLQPNLFKIKVFIVLIIVGLFIHLSLSYYLPLSPANYIARLLVFLALFPILGLQYVFPVISYFLLFITSLLSKFFFLFLSQFSFGIKLSAVISIVIIDSLLSIPYWYLLSCLIVKIIRILRH